MKPISTFKFMLRVLVLLLISSALAYTQPCGLNVKIKVSCGTSTCVYQIDTTGYQSGWYGYKYEWKINDEPTFTDPGSGLLSYDQIAAGFNRLTITAYGTNPGTGDSCVQSYTNIFQATGDAVYPEFDVSVNGNTVTFNGTYKGGPFNFTGFNADYDFGDGNTSTGSIIATHTYANPGTKLVSLNVSISNSTGSTAFGYYARSINIGTGASNVEFSSIQSNVLCDSVQLYVNSSVPFTNGSIIENYAVVGNAPVNGSYTHIPMAEVPGHDFILVEGFGALVGEDRNYHVVPLNDCGIIPDTVSGYVFEDLNYNGLREPGEPALAGKRIYISSNCNAYMSSTFQASYSTYTDTAGYYSIIVPHYQVLVNFEKPAGYTLTYPQNTYHYANFNTGTMHSGFNFGVSALSVYLCGNTYLDDNNDSLFVFPDRALSGVMLTATNTLTNLVFRTYSNTSGNYCFELPPGSYVVRPVNWPIDSATFTPDSLVVNAGTGGSFYNRNFGFRSPVPVDFNIHLSSTTEARPGFSYALSNRVINTGYLKGKGEIICSYDPLLTPVNVNPVNGVINTTNHTVTWTTDSIIPGEEKYYTANFTIPVATPLGTVLSNSTTITALPGTVENDLSDNSSIKNHTVIGSFDPNDKTVSPAGIGATGDVLHDTELNYLIRFQNTGTASAINVFVADTIDNDLDLNTLVIHRASHSYDLVINENVLTWRFFSINLPDSNTNEPASHGFIEYSISPKAGLTDGTTIDNKAYIYFDFNAPVVTNTTLNTTWSSLTALEEVNKGQQLIVYPNPGNDKIVVLPRRALNGNVTITLFDITGKKIKTLIDHDHLNETGVESDVRDLSKGIYIIELRDDTGVESVKWVKQ